MLQNSTTDHYIMQIHCHLNLFLKNLLIEEKSTRVTGNSRSPLTTVKHPNVGYFFFVKMFPYVCKLSSRPFFSPSENYPVDGFRPQVNILRGDWLLCMSITKPETRGAIENVRQIYPTGKIFTKKYDKPVSSALKNWDKPALGLSAARY